MSRWKAWAAGQDAVEAGNELSQPTFQFKILIISGLGQREHNSLTAICATAAECMLLQWTGYQNEAKLGT